MKKKLKKLLVGVMLGSMLVPTNVWGQSTEAGAAVAGEGISPRISVSKYVEIKVGYMFMDDIPQYYPYSYYDYDYNTTLKGTLVLKDTRVYDDGIVAYYGGHCSGSI